MDPHIEDAMQVARETRHKSDNPEALVLAEHVEFLVQALEDAETKLDEKPILDTNMDESDVSTIVQIYDVAEPRTCTRANCYEQTSWLLSAVFTNVEPDEHGMHTGKSVTLPGCTKHIFQFLDEMVFTEE
jgi:hypothetical protein